MDQKNFERPRNSLECDWSSLLEFGKASDWFECIEIEMTVDNIHELPLGFGSFHVTYHY